MPENKLCMNSELCLSIRHTSRKSSWLNRMRSEWFHYIRVWCMHCIVHYASYSICSFQFQISKHIQHSFNTQTVNNPFAFGNLKFNQIFNQQHINLLSFDLLIFEIEFKMKLYVIIIINVEFCFDFLQFRAILVTFNEVFGCESKNENEFIKCMNKSKMLLFERKIPLIKEAIASHLCNQSSETTTKIISCYSIQRALPIGFSSHCKCFIFEIAWRPINAQCYHTTLQTIK